MEEPGSKERQHLDRRSRGAGEKLLRALHGSDVQALVELALDEDGLAGGVLLTLMPGQAERLAKLLTTRRRNFPWSNRGEP